MTRDTSSDTGCVPYCVPGPSETCVKYTEWTGKHMSYTSAVTTIYKGKYEENELLFVSFVGK